MRLPKLAVVLLAASALAAGCARAPWGSPSPSQGRVIEAVADFLGAPYVPGGEDRRGLDCSGLVLAAYRLAGLELPHNTAALVGVGRPVGEEDLEPADILLFGQAGTGECESADHCGIYLGEGRFAHASASRGVCVSSLASRYWRERLLCARRCLEND
jgi:cell wall-associated NlpC family hydrolase